MSAIEVMAVIFSLLVLAKVMGIFILGPRKWMKFSKTVYKHKTVLSLILFLLTLIVGYFLFSSFPITTVMAVLLFCSLLLGLGLIPYVSAFIREGKKVLATRKDFLKQLWLVLLVWVFLAVWTLIAMLN